MERVLNELLEGMVREPLNSLRKTLIAGPEILCGNGKSVLSAWTVCQDRALPCALRHIQPVLYRRASRACPRKRQTARPIDAHHFRGAAGATRRTHLVPIPAVPRTLSLILLQEARSCSYFE